MPSGVHIKATHESKALAAEVKDYLSG
jgi:hypothetical protein